jgi:hypothetical protein
MKTDDLTLTLTLDAMKVMGCPPALISAVNQLKSQGYKLTPSEQKRVARAVDNFQDEIEPVMTRALKSRIVVELRSIADEAAKPRK